VAGGVAVAAEEVEEEEEEEEDYYPYTDRIVDGQFTVQKTENSKAAKGKGARAKQNQTGKSEQTEEEAQGKRKKEHVKTFVWTPRKSAKVTPPRPATQSPFTPEKEWPRGLEFGSLQNPETGSPLSDAGDAYILEHLEKRGIVNGWRVQWDNSENPYVSSEGPLWVEQNEHTLLLYARYKERTGKTFKLNRK
jgi:hypothetical protein